MSPPGPCALSPCAPRPYRLDLPEERLAALRERLLHITWPDEPVGHAPWSTGTSVAYLRGLVDYWRDGFDWRARERAFNGLRQFQVELGGIDLHYVHEAGIGPAPMPLLLAHGWPSTVLDFADLIPRLTDPGRHGGDPADAFTVVAPSLPGYPLSFRAGQPRLGLAAITDVLAALMTDVLGYSRFGAGGGDWGAFLTAMLGQSRPERTIGLHLTMLPTRRIKPGDAPDEQAFAAAHAAFLREETGYHAIQGTRPQTLAFALQDSPVGLAAWMVEKFRAWSDNAGAPEDAVTRDQMLQAITLYWATGAVGASFWPYYDMGRSGWPLGREPIAVPMGYAAFPREILRPPRSVAARTFADIRRWTEMPRGGHFAALEQPAALADEIRAFFRPLRTA